MYHLCAFSNLITYILFSLHFSRFHRNLTLGVAALTCHLHACRHQSETKSRKYLARAIWMLTYDDEKVCPTVTTLVQYMYTNILSILYRAHWLKLWTNITWGSPLCTGCHGECISIGPFDCCIVHEFV